MTQSWQWQLESIILLPYDNVPQSINTFRNNLQSNNEEFKKEEVEGLLGFIESLSSGRIQDSIKNKWSQQLWEPFLKTFASVPELSNSIMKTYNNILSNPDTPRTGNHSLPTKELGILALAVYFFNLYLQANWTGPSINDFNLQKSSDSINIEDYNNINEMPKMTCHTFFQTCILGDPNSSERGSHFLNGILNDLNIDGEILYELARGISYLWAAIFLLQFLTYSNENNSQSLLTTFLWYPRILFIWQKSIRRANINASPSLLNISIFNYQNSLTQLQLLPENFNKKMENNPFTSFQSNHYLENDEILSNFRLCNPHLPLLSYKLPPPTYFSDVFNSSLLLELAVRLSFYGYVDSYYLVEELACKALKFVYQLSGTYGLRRKYQREAIVQLVVGTPENTDKDKFITQSVSTPNIPNTITSEKQLSLEYVNPDTDIFETPKLNRSSEDGWDYESPLTAYEQLLLLAKCSNLIASNPSSAEMTFEELNSIVQRCLILPKKHPHETSPETSDVTYLSTHWLIHSAGLWFRCKSEYHRSKTIERACLQLQSLVDQYHDAHPSGPHRLAFIHQVDYPSLWEAKRELGSKMLKIGSFLSAFNMFQDMMMWEEAVECLVSASRKNEAIELVEKRLSIAPSPPLWCLKGSLYEDPDCYIKAWTLSKNRYANAQRHLGSYYFKKGSYLDAIEAFEKALKINPLRANVWFTMGCSAMRIEDWTKALSAFSKVISIEPDQGEAWANMAGVHIQLNQWNEASQAIEQALKYNRDDWRMWDTFLKISIKLRNIGNTIQATRVILEDLNQKDVITLWVFDFLYTMLNMNDDDQTEPFITKRDFANLLEIFEMGTNKLPGITKISLLYSKLLRKAGQIDKSFEFSIQHLRKLQKNLFDPGYKVQNTIKLKEEMSSSLYNITDIIQQATVSDASYSLMTKKNEMLLTMTSLENRLKNFDAYSKQIIDQIKDIKEILYSL